MESCILSKFHIKPQRCWTNNKRVECCILSKFHIKPQPPSGIISTTPGCILSKFHIKPQQNRSEKNAFGVVSYRNSTSNHNETLSSSMLILLYLIEIPHQTTTRGVGAEPPDMLYLIEIPHQTTTTFCIMKLGRRCILSKFHIKPQQRIRHKIGHSVVSYRNSTSNHNSVSSHIVRLIVVSYRNSTSNHNSILRSLSSGAVVSYRNSTSNHNSSKPFGR